MAGWKFGRNRTGEFGLSSLSPNATLAVLTAAAAAPFFVLLSFVPPALFLPVLSSTCLAGATLFAIWAWTSGARWESNAVTRWDVAGALAFIGFAAALLSEPEHVLRIAGPT